MCGTLKCTAVAGDLHCTHTSSLSSLTEAESEISAVYMHKRSCCSTRNDSLKHTTGTAAAPAIVEPRWCGVLLKLKKYFRGGDLCIYLEKYEYIHQEILEW